MPQNLYPLHKKIQKQNLDTVQVYLEDKTPTSPNYFIFSDIPAEFTAGKNSFKIFANPDTLETGSRILVEILDAAGNPVYYEVSDYIDRSKRRVISIYIYPETAFGIASIYVLGVASKDFDGVRIPNEWKGNWNIRWSHDIFIDPLKRNKSEIIFDNLPDVQVSEIFGSYNKINYRNQPTHYVTTIPTASIEYRYLPSDKQQAQNFEQVKKATTSNLIGQPDAGENVQLSVNLDATEISNERSSISNDIIAPAGFEYDLSEGAILTVDGDFTFEENMVGGTLVFENPQNLFPATELSGSYEPVISEVLNSTQAKASFPFQLSSSRDDKITIKSFPSESFEITYKTQPEYSSSQAFRTFSFMRFGNLDPISGEVYRIKTFVKSNASVTDYELIGNTIIGAKNLFIDSGSLSMEESYGDFTSLEFIENYWAADQGIAGFAPILSYSSANLYNGLKITGLGLPQGGNEYWKLYPSCSDPSSSLNEPYFFKDNQYQLKFNVYGSNSDGIKPKVKIYMSGSAFIESPSTEGFGKYVGEIEMNASSKTYRNLAMNFSTDLSGSGVPIFKIESGYWNFSDIRILPLDESGFSPNHFNMMLPINSIWDENILDFKFEFYDYSDNLASQYVEMKNVSFMSGSPSYVQGRHNLVTGSQFIGNRIGTGIQMAGTDSAFIMNPDYNGFVSASDEKLGGSAGFMIWSGSVHPEWPDAYDGVGIELIANSSSYFRYRTNPSELDIRTDKFYFGGDDNYISGETGSINIQADNIILSGSGVGIYTQNFFLGSSEQFLSGSNGNIEISSSNFHLSASGDVTAKAARLEHYVYADFVGSRVITIDASNYSDYVKEYFDPIVLGTGYSYLDLSQEESGSSMFIRFETSSNYPITHIVAPNVIGVEDSDVGATITTEFAVSASVEFYDMSSGSRDITGTPILTELNAIHNLSGSFSYTGFSHQHQSIDTTYEYTGSLRGRDNARYVWTKGIGWGLNSTTNYDRTNVSFLKANISFQYGTRRNEWIPAQAMSFTDLTGSAADSFDDRFMMPCKDLTLALHEIATPFSGEANGYNGIYGSFLLPDYIESKDIDILLYYSVPTCVSSSGEDFIPTHAAWYGDVKTIDYQVPNDFSNTNQVSMSAQSIYNGGRSIDSFDNQFSTESMFVHKIGLTNEDYLQSGKPVGVKFEFEFMFDVLQTGTSIGDVDGTIRIYGMRVITDKETNQGGFDDGDLRDTQDQQQQQN